MSWTRVYRYYSKTVSDTEVETVHDKRCSGVSKSSSVTAVYTAVRLSLGPTSGEIHP